MKHSLEENLIAKTVNVSIHSEQRLLKNKNLYYLWTIILIYVKDALI